jgi:CBS domain-containing protein
MKVKDVMTKHVTSCHPGQNLGEVVENMWRFRCGAMPIVSDEGRVMGIITDRDMCIALGTRDLRASEVTAADVAPARYFACRPDDDIHSALKTMAAQEVRRLVVIDDYGKLAGILSIDDVVVRARPGSSINYSEVVRTMQAICENRVHRTTDLAAIA